MTSPIGSLSASCSLAILLSAAPALAGDPCPEQPALAHWTGAGTVACACFVAGEEAGAVFDIPANHLPAEILRVGIGFGSQIGGQPQQLEQAINIRQGGLPTPGAIIESLSGPVLTDGVINEFDLEPLPGEITISSNPFTVTLEFANDNVGDPFSATMVHDGNGCTGGKNVVKAIPGGWFNACALGVTGDWLVQVVYRPLNCDGPAEIYCVSNANSAGPGAQIGIIGSTSLAANDLILTCQGGPPNKPGLFFYGPNQVQLPFGAGFRCVGGGIWRMPPVQTFDVFGNAAYVVDYGQSPFNSGGGQILSGSMWNFQFWYRDPGFAGHDFNLSNGIKLTFSP